jgi:phage baseplate assembly protein W
MDFFLRTKKDPNNSFHDDITTTYFFGQGTNDLQVDTNGDFALTQGTANLSQSMAKIAVTGRGSNALFTLYGTLLQNLVGQRLDLEFLRAKIKSELIDGLRIYQFINKDNPNLDEQIDTLNVVKISQLTDSAVNVEFNVTTKSGKVVGAVIELAP